MQNQCANYDATGYQQVVCLLHPAVWTSTVTTPPRQEGIYVGYRYYETRYADAVNGVGNARFSGGCSTTMPPPSGTTTTR